jgi:hypothetical protein
MPLRRSNMTTENQKLMWHYWLLDYVNIVNILHEILQNCNKVFILRNDSNISKLDTKKLRTDLHLESFLQQLTAQGSVLASLTYVLKTCSNSATLKKVFFSYTVWSLSFLSARLERAYYTTYYSIQNSFYIYYAYLEKEMKFKLVSLPH